jgi:hypothetical protein
MDRMRLADATERERVRQDAEREARARAETTLQQEIARARADVDTRLAAELADLRAEAQQRRAVEIAELEQIRAQLAEAHVSASEQARSAVAVAVSSEVARAEVWIPRAVGLAKAGRPIALATLRTAGRVVRWADRQRQVAVPAIRSAMSRVPARTFRAAAAILVLVATAAVFDLRSLTRPLVPIAKQASTRAAAVITELSSGGSPAATATASAPPPESGDAAVADVVPESTPLSGMLTVTSRVPVDLLVGGRRIGASDEGQIFLPEGRHAVTLVNQRFGFTDTVTITVKSGRVTTHAVRLPEGVVQVHTEPGATLFIDGARVGVAPLGPVLVTIGTRQITVTHPELGERREGVEVRQDSPAELTLMFEHRRGPADPSSMPPLTRTPVN